MKLTATEWQALLSRIRNNDPTLKELNLYQREIGDQGVRELTHALKTNSFLIVLDLKENNIKKLGVQALVDLLKKNHILLRLNLSWNLIDDSCVQVLAEALKVNHFLSSLDLGSNKITSIGATYLIDALKANQSLTTLNLTNYGVFFFGNKNEITEPNQNQIKELLTRNRFLKGQLFQAIQTGDLQRVESLVQQGVNLLSVIDEGEHKDNTPLHWAIMYKKVDIAAYLIQLMQRKNIPLTQSNAQGKLAEQLATHTDLARLFLEPNKPSSNSDNVIALFHADARTSSNQSTSATTVNRDKVSDETEYAASAPALETSTITTVLSTEEFQQCLENIIKGSLQDREKLISYFDNKNGILTAQMLETHQRLAFEYFSQIITQNQNKHAQSFLGKCYLSGLNVKIDYDEAYKWYLIAAKQGEVAAQFQLGFMYSKPLGLKQDYLQALHWYGKAAEQNYIKAQYNLGVMYFKGQGIKKDDVEAVKWIRKAAEQNHIKAQYKLGLMYFKGQGIKKNDVEAVKWIRKAAEQNHIKAQSNLGLMYSRGQGVKKDYAEATKWCRKAADQNEPIAQHYIGHLYTNGYGVEQDIVEAMKWYRKAAEQGIAGSQFIYGMMIMGGRGDKIEGLEWYRKSAEQNCAAAQCQLGILYEKGNGVKQDYVKAFNWYHKAAEQNHEIAQSNLGLMYVSGRGVVKNIPQAVYWFLLAAEQQDSEAIKSLATLENQGYGNIITEQQQILLTEKRQKKIENEKLKNSQSEQNEYNSSQSSETNMIANAIPTLEIAPNSKNVASNAGIKVSLIIDSTKIKTQRLLGEGAYGKVHFGLWNNYIEVAIKELKVSGLPDAMKEDFRNEAQVMANLRSPRIVQLYGVCFESPFCLVMEYMSKGSLFDVLHGQETISWSQRIRIGLDTGEGLHFLHVQDPVILHRDLKSLNVLLDIHFRAKLTDFGLAQAKQIINSTSKQQTNSSKSVGTIAWMAPESFARKPDYSTASDVYAYGMVLWEMATRKIPFQDAADPSLITMWVTQGDREDIPSETPIQYAALIKRCWDGRRELRPTVNDILIELKTMEHSPQPANFTTASNTSSSPSYDAALVSTNDGPQYDAGSMSQIGR